MMMRPASPDDLESIVTLTTAAYRPYTELLGASPIPVTEDYAPRIERGEVWLREVDGETAGLVVVEQHSDHLMLFSIAVSPAFQGAGHGLSMLRWLEDKAREWAVPEIRLYTNALMERNIARYRAFGFQETGRRPNPYRPGWTLVDMMKEINAA
ncbi:GNAT family N-acetyltransferase [Rhizobium pisi]|uniref:GNAT family N-acetyltransferase n=1 Tax=Rhizobium pisi TaxID=574561 RepID=UPI0039B0B401